MKIKEILRLSAPAVIVASLCCLSPLILVVFGIGTLGFATSLADTLYGDYKWYFRLAGLLVMFIAIIIYLRRNKNICTLDAAKRRRNEVINIVMSALVVGVLGYLFFLYVVVHYLGFWLKIWN